MSKLKKSPLLLLLLIPSFLFSDNMVQAVSENSDSSAMQSVSENSDSGAVQSVSENSDGTNKQAATDTSDSDIIRLVCPTEYPFFIARDREEAAYLNSRVLHIANYSNKDILIDLSKVHLEPGENASYNELSAPVEKNYVSETKDVFAFLKVVDSDPDSVSSPDSFGTSEIPPEGALPSEGEFILTGENKTTEYVVLLKAANYNEDGEFVSLQPESIFSFYIAGSVTPNKDLIWNKGDISIKVIISYSVVPSDDIKSPDTANLSDAESKE